MTPVVVPKPYGDDWAEGSPNPDNPEWFGLLMIGILFGCVIGGWILARWIDRSKP